MVPRIGMKIQLPVQFDNLEYYGRGPLENYIDRRDCADVGLYKSSVADQYVPYIRPQENGHKTGIRWFALYNSDYTGLLVAADSLLEFNALHNTVEDFDAGVDKDKNSMHTVDITPRNLVEVNVDYKMMGVGGDDSWGALPHKEYMIHPSERKFEYGFTIIPFTNTEDVNKLIH